MIEINNVFYKISQQNVLPYIGNPQGIGPSANILIYTRYTDIVYHRMWDTFLEISANLLIIR